MKIIKKTFFSFVPLAFAIVFIGGLSYIMVQQNYRESLNDPQIVFSKEIKDAVESGKNTAEIVGSLPHFDIQNSLSVFVAFFDKNGTPLSSSASLGGKPPAPPSGIFADVQKTGENRVTWQPNSTTRVAIVVRPINSSETSFVVVGRNMSEVENRIDKITKLFLCGILFILIFTFFLQFILETIKNKHKPNFLI